VNYNNQVVIKCQILQECFLQNFKCKIFQNMEHSNSRTFQGLSRTYSVFQDFQGPWIFFLKFKDFQGLLKDPMNPVKTTGGIFSAPQQKSYAWGWHPAHFTSSLKMYYFRLAFNVCWLLCCPCVLSVRDVLEEHRNDDDDDGTTQECDCIYDLLQITNTTMC